MDRPTAFPSLRLGADTVALRSYAPLPGLGVLPVNAYLILGREPVLVDTGMAALREPFLAALREHIDPAALRWIWATHIDADHIGNLRPLLEMAPQARVVTNYLGVGKLGLQDYPAERCHLVNPGQRLDLGDRRLLALRPPVYDAPETMAVFDEATGFLFSSDCFGALLPEPCEHVRELAAPQLEAGMQRWATIDAPWLHTFDADEMARGLQAIERLAPKAVLSTHLPVATDVLPMLLATLASAGTVEPFVGPDQASLMAVLQGAPAGQAPEAVAA